MSLLNFERFVGGKSTEKFLYFAFGSNLSSERIRIQNPSAKFVSVALLNDYRLHFNGYSTVSSKNLVVLVFKKPFKF